MIITIVSHYDYQLPVFFTTSWGLGALGAPGLTPGLTLGALADQLSATSISVILVLTVLIYIYTPIFSHY